MRKLLLASASVVILSTTAAFATGNSQTANQGGSALTATQTISNSDYITQDIEQPNGTLNNSNQNADNHSYGGAQTSTQDGSGNHNTVTQSMHHATRSTLGRNKQTATQHGETDNRIDQTITNGDDNVQTAKQEHASHFRARQTTENSANGNTQKIDQHGGTGTGGHAYQDVNARSGNDQWIGQFHNSGAIAEQTVTGPGPAYQYGGNDQDIVQVGTVNTQAFQTISGGTTYNGHETEDNNQFIAQTGTSNFARQNINLGDTDSQVILQGSTGNTALQTVNNSIYSSQKIIQSGANNNAEQSMSGGSGNSQMINQSGSGNVSHQTIL